jgi:hypothetical protein
MFIEAFASRGSVNCSNYRGIRHTELFERNFVKSLFIVSVLAVNYAK